MNLEYWSGGVVDGVMEYWSIGVMEYWSIGVMEYRSIGGSTSQTTDYRLQTTRGSA